MKENPYNRLLRIARQFAFDTKYRHRKAMWSYPKDKLTTGWRLDDLAERVQAADQLGYDVQLKVVEGSLHAEYVKRPSVPSELS